MILFLVERERKGDGVREGEEDGEKERDLRRISDSGWRHDIPS